MFVPKRVKFKGPLTLIAVFPPPPIGGIAPAFPNKSVSVEAVTWSVLPSL